MKKPVDVFSAPIVSNYDIDATGGGLWIDTTHYKYTVGTYKRAFLYGGVVNRDANQTCDVMLYDSGNHIILYLADQAAATGITHYPDTTLGGAIMRPIPMDAGWYVQATFGGAQAAAAYATCMVQECTFS